MTDYSAVVDGSLPPLSAALVDSSSDRPVMDSTGTRTPPSPRQSTSSLEHKSPSQPQTQTIASILDTSTQRTSNTAPSLSQKASTTTASDGSQTSPSLSMATTADHSSYVSTTPPTSWSNISSQDNYSNLRTKLSPKTSFSNDIDAIERTSLSSRSSRSPVKDEVDAVAGHKRTAAGEIKTPKRTSPQGLSRGRANSIESNISRASDVQQMTQTIRARLSYAAMKVQNGWDAVENDAYIGSPMSTATIHGTPRSTFTSPRTETGEFRRQWSESSEEGLNRSRFVMNGVNLSSTIPKMPSQSPPRSYPKYSHDSQSQKRLDPAAPISNLISSSQPLPTLPRPDYPSHPSSQPPSTPPRPMKIRTPSMNTTRENDAIESLMSLSSPVNGYPRTATMNGSAMSSARASPQKSHFDRTPYASHHHNDHYAPASAQEEMTSPYRHHQGTYARFPDPPSQFDRHSLRGTGSADTLRSRVPGYVDDHIDRMLDKMADDETLDGDETEEEPMDEDKADDGASQGQRSSASTISMHSDTEDEPTGKYTAASEKLPPGWSGVKTMAQRGMRREPVFVGGGGRR